MDDLLPDEEDLLYEEELLRNPYSLRMWDRYIQARKGAPPKRRYLLYERALRALPGSFKVSPLLLKLHLLPLISCSALQSQPIRCLWISFATSA